MDEATRTQLSRIDAAIEFMANLEGQDPMLIVEMSQAMLADVIETGELRPMADYVKQYCDVIDSPEDAEQYAAMIAAEEG